eukprot:CAMPEP_0116978120 /NCGR_PEP_ID=MMETSP0467-20121206/57577_1 /TAXON_ID=283647 /ORGANISM="Mesodinium pulex, Strain SPMC105" /LENGTH=44 /DNA_ID= /DNA_START= /DNA_END= /DNA_ORIENTATION=
MTAMRRTRLPTGSLGPQLNYPSPISAGFAHARSSATGKQLRTRS